MSQVETPWSDARLVHDGWTRRFTAMGSRLNEAVALYRELGFEIRLELAEPAVAEGADTSGCAECFVMSLARTIYTRPRNAPADERAVER